MTEEGKALALQRSKWSTKEERVLIPGGRFTGGSNKKKDRMAYRSEIPQRHVYADDFGIDNFEVTAIESLRFVVAPERLPLSDWIYDGENFQESMPHHPVMQVSWTEAEAYCR